MYLKKKHFIELTQDDVLPSQGDPNDWTLLELLGKEDMEESL